MCRRELAAIWQNLTRLLYSQVIVLSFEEDDFYSHKNFQHINLAQLNAYFSRYSSIFELQNTFYITEELHRFEMLVVSSSRC